MDLDIRLEVLESAITDLEAIKDDLEDSTCWGIEAVIDAVCDALEVAKTEWRVAEDERRLVIEQEQNFANEEYQRDRI